MTRKRPRAPKPVGRFARLAPSSFLLFVAVFAVAASVAALVVVYNTGGRIIAERERAEALADQDLLGEVDQEQGLSGAAAAVARRARFSTAGEHYGLFSPTNQPLAGDITDYDPAFRVADWKVVRARIGQRTVAVHVEGLTLPDGAVLVVGRSLANMHRFERSIFFGFLAAVAIVAGAGLAAGLQMNFLILQQVTAVAGTAERIVKGDLSARTAVSKNPRDPFGRMGASLNAMLAQIEELLTGMRTVTDSLAHDLRSPLTRAKGALAHAMHPAAGESERLDAIEAAHRELDHVLATLSAMLDIARAETGLSREMMQPVDVAGLVVELADFFSPVIEDAGQQLCVEAPQEPVMARGHEALLRQAVGNLLHNAAQYGGEGVRVTVRVEAQPDVVRIVVADSGGGVPQDQRGRVQERFVRLDPARSAGGSGLGLAIVAACAKLHGGALSLEDNAPGLRAVLQIRRS